MILFIITGIVFAWAITTQFIYINRYHEAHPVLTAVNPLLGLVFGYTIYFAFFQQ